MTINAHRHVSLFDMSGYPPKEPNITKEHFEFHRHVSTAAQQMSSFILEQLYGKFGEPPFNLKEDLARFAESDINFGPSEGTSSRYFEADIAGCDAFAIKSIMLPSEVTQRGYDGNYPSRILEIILGYGKEEVPAHTSTYYLYAGPKVLPVMVHQEAADTIDLRNAEPYYLGSLDVYKEHLPENVLYYLDANELYSIRRNLATLTDDICLRRFVQTAYDSHEASLDSIKGTPKEQSESTWLWSCSTHLALKT